MLYYKSTFEMLKCVKHNLLYKFQKLYCSDAQKEIIYVKDEDKC
jgi:hypothetical protein